MIYKILIFVILFIAILNFALFVKILKRKNIFAKVSFYLDGEHIFIKGLIDSGNNVYDSSSKLPVIFVSLDGLKKYFSDISMQNIKNLYVSHYEYCMVVGGKTIFVPIIKVKGCSIKVFNKWRNCKFVIGILNQEFFDDEAYHCLIHRKFLNWR